ncbi:hypothetical protein GQ42DRAFT_28096 [Ramicandelaber brevisporus]|nr:hypothetical protein GQ42DRAFT_28096 [Ramicandelaber brevisporus]
MTSEKYYSSGSNSNQFGNEAGDDDDSNDDDSWEEIAGATEQLQRLLRRGQSHLQANLNSSKKQQAYDTESEQTIQKWLRLVAFLPSCRELTSINATALHRYDEGALDTVDVVLRRLTTKQSVASTLASTTASKTLVPTTRIGTQIGTNVNTDGKKRSGIDVVAVAVIAVDIDRNLDVRPSTSVINQAELITKPIAKNDVSYEDDSIAKVEWPKIPRKAADNTVSEEAYILKQCRDKLRKAAILNDSRLPDISDPNSPYNPRPGDSESTRRLKAQRRAELMSFKNIA